MLGREEEKRKRAVESVKAKIGAVKESLEAPNPGAGAVAAMASSAAESNPYSQYDVKADEEDSNEVVEDSVDEELDESELDLKLKNLDLHL